jgi:hypothetical protein
METNNLYLQLLAQIFLFMKNIALLKFFFNSRFIKTKVYHEGAFAYFSYSVYSLLFKNSFSSSAGAKEKNHYNKKFFIQ